MPLYDYRCVSCGREVEVMHGIHDHGPEACEACGGAMSKVLSAPTIHFKGSGWAKKDAAASSAKKASPKAPSTATASDKSGDGASSKSDAKAQGASAEKGGGKTSASGAKSD